MPSAAMILGFIAASLVVLITPGPGVLYVIARTLAQGYFAGLVSVLGLSAGAFLQVVAATVGLSAILVASSTAFEIVKLVGAGYLVYLGLRALFARRNPASDATTTPEIPRRLLFRRLFVDGVVVSLFNPKIALFFLAFLPQFVDPSRGEVSQQILLLGLIYVALAFLTDGTYALLTGSTRLWIRKRTASMTFLRYLSGGTYLGLGINAALAERPS